MTQIHALYAQKDFEIETLLSKPLMAHLSTVADGEPRDSPVWFLWEESSMWVFGTDKDSFIKRLHREPRCAVGVVDFDLNLGILKHVGIRGTSEIISVCQDRLYSFISKYLGVDRSKWNQWFLDRIVEPLNAMVRITPSSIVAKNASFFKTGPNLANDD